nr:hypothetical protein [Tanacetum cinerariifolium]
MNPNSSLRKICLGDDVVVISSDKVEGSRDWNSPEYQDTVVSKGKNVVKTLSFYRMETDEISERYIAPCFVNGLEAYDERKELVKKELIVALKGELYFLKFIINPEEDDYEPRDILGRSFLRLAHGVVDFGIGPSSSSGSHLTQEEAEKAEKEALAVRISQKDKVELDGKTVKEEEDAVNRIKGEALKEKDDLGAFIFPIKLEGKVNENSLVDTGSDINTMPYRIYETLGREKVKKIDSILNTPYRLFSTFDGVYHQTLRAARFDVLRTAESDSNDEEEYVIKRNRGIRRSDKSSQEQHHVIDRINEIITFLKH